jgi:hypothetical protein
MVQEMEEFAYTDEERLRVLRHDKEDAKWYKDKLGWSDPKKIFTPTI